MAFSNFNIITMMQNFKSFASWQLTAGLEVTGESLFNSFKFANSPNVSKRYIHMEHFSYCHLSIQRNVFCNSGTTICYRVILQAENATLPMCGLTSYSKANVAQIMLTHFTRGSISLQLTWLTVLDLTKHLKSDVH